MFQRYKLSVLYFICIALVSCNMGRENTRLTFEAVSDSVYKSSDEYKQNLLVFKNYYEQCMHEQLFKDAFYLQLQEKMYIGSINNDHEFDVNRGVNILDTSNNKNIFDLLAIISSANCNDTISLNDNVRKVIYDVVVKTLNASTDYKGLTDLIDPVHMKLRIASVYNTTLRTDSLISLLNRTQDSSLIRFKQLLLMPGNALLAQTIEVQGFGAEFALKGKLSAQQKKQFEKEVFFTPDGSGEYSSILLLPNNHLRVQINKRYTVLGRFLTLKAE
jgi:hypothetical protein